MAGQGMKPPGKPVQEMSGGDGLAASPVSRVFLGWTRPAVESLLDYLCQTVPTTPGKPARWDLSAYRVVLPTRWSTRRLLARLAETAQSKKVMLLPPEVITIGQLPETLYPRRYPLADEVTSLLAWCAALKFLAYSDIEALQSVFPAWQEDRSFSHQLSYAQVLLDFHREIMGAGWDCEQILQEARARDAAFPDTARWQALAALQRLYHHILQGSGYVDLYFAWREAVRSNACHTGKRILLAGLVDIPRLMRQMLRQVAYHLTVLVMAPQDLADHFDELGCLIPQKWQQLPVEIPPKQITVCQQPADQAAAVVDVLCQWADTFSVEEVTIGLPDESILPLVTDSLTRWDIPARYGPGRPVRESPVCVLLHAIQDFLTQPTVRAFATLVRHPAVERWLRSKPDMPPDLLTTLDAWIAQRLAYMMDENGMKKETGPVKRMWQMLWERLDPASWQRSHLPQESAEKIRGLLLDFFGADDDPDGFQQDEETFQVCQSILAALQGWERVPESLRANLPWQGTPLEMLSWLEQNLQNQRIPAEPHGPAVELMGWLDVPWDDAPATIVTSVNEGRIPSHTGSDPFLPTRLREWLGLNDHLRRAARDAYSLSLIVASRSAFHLIAGRQNLEGDPLLPSRFLFSSDDETMIRQVQAAFGLSEAPAKRRPPRWETPTSEGRCLEPPPPSVVPDRWQEIRVTQFRDYLACPYRFYLRHVIGANTVDDDVQELDPAGFGSLAHEVLCRLGRSDLKDSTAADAIAEFLTRQLDRLVKERFAASPLAPLPIQVEQLKARLRAFATFQADHAQLWEIVATEFTPRQPVLLDVDRDRIRLVGRIDRIDRHRETGEYLILDYKVTDTDDVSPERLHRKTVAGQRVWIDLQLPLYRRLAGEIIGKSPVQLGYILLPKRLESTGKILADWDDDELDEAEDVARDVVRKIWQGIFWPPSDEAAGKFPDLAPIIP